MRFSSLGSGSEGNALLVQVSNTVVMMDCGFGLAETEARLARAGVSPGDLDAILVTHEHSDHIGGVARFARKHGIPVWLTHGTAKVLTDGALPAALRHYVDPHEDFSVDDMQITPYFVPHDAYEPVQYVFSDGNARLGVLTDTGSITAHIQETLSGCNALVLECNHDLDMLMNGPYPVSLKRRVAGKFGHLDNMTAASLLSGMDCSKLKHVIAAHLSKQNNLPELAAAALAEALSCEPDWIGIAGQANGFSWREI
ncbi:MAG: MBL fold metallo-hydrolase [Betaproteobacteria bacterium]|nr:MBL fold metallo-hydrolase [Betaproteobacteria bacterium]